MNEQNDDVLREAFNWAQQLCETAQASGYAVIYEGSVWLSTRRHIEEEGDIYQRSDFSQAEFWVELCESEPIPVHGPDDPELLNFLVY